MEITTKYKKGDIVVIHSKTSSNNKRVCIVLGYTNGKYNDIIRVKMGKSIFNIKEESISLASIYDIIRNMSDKELEKLIPKYKRKKISKKTKKKI